jgi:hypothetical protein
MIQGTTDTNIYNYESFTNNGAISGRLSSFAKPRLESYTQVNPFHCIHFGTWPNSGDHLAKNTIIHGAVPFPVAKCDFIQ